MSVVKAYTSSTSTTTDNITFTNDGTKNRLDVEANLLIEGAEASSANPVPINITSSDISIGGGTEYTEGDTDATITGGVIMWEDTSDTIVATSAAKPLPVNIISGSSSGTEYTEGDTDATITGTAIMWEDAGDTLKPVSASSPLPVDLKASTGSVTVDDGGGSITVDGTVSVTEPVSVDDNGGSLTVDNSTLSVVGGGTEATAMRVTIANNSTGVLSVDDNGSSLTVDNAALSVTGGGTETGALRVTIATNSTGVLSVDDNGSSLTVDNAALSVTGGGTEAGAQRVTIASDSTGVLSVDDNGSTLSVDDGGGSLTVDGSVTVEGTTPAASVYTDNPVVMGAIDVTGRVRSLAAISVSGFYGLFNIPADTGGDSIDFSSSGESYSLIGSTDGTKANSSYLRIDSSDNLLVVGNIAHDSADSGNPILVGGRAIAEATPPTAVAADDRVRAFFNLQGYQMIKNEPYRSSVTQIFSSQAFNATTSANSTEFDGSRYRMLRLYISLTSSGSPTNLRLIPQFEANATWFDHSEGTWTDFRYVTAQTSLTRTMLVPWPGDNFRLRGVATGTNGSDTFTLSVWCEGIS